MNVACFSVAAADFFPQQNEWYAGGNSLNQAVRFSQMGFRSAFAGAIGTDDAGDRIEKLLRKEHVDISLMQRLEGFTARNKIINDASGERFGIDGAWESGVYESFCITEEIWNALWDFDVWATHANSPVFRTTLKRKNHRQFLSVDFLHLRDFELLEESIKIVDVAFFGGTEDMAEDLSRIAQTAPEKCIVLTLGANGSIAFSGCRRYAQSALSLEQVIDTTGCGDAFQAGFTASYYHEHDIAKALSKGAELGRIAAMSYGGVPWK